MALVGIGTIGDKDFHYINDGLFASWKILLGSEEIRYLCMPESDCLGTDGQNLITRLQAELDAIEDDCREYYASLTGDFEQDIKYGTYTNGAYKKFLSSIPASLDFHSYKYCIFKDPLMNRYRVVYADSSSGWTDCDWVAVQIRYSGWLNPAFGEESMRISGIQILDGYGLPIQDPYDDPIITGSFGTEVFNSIEACEEWLFDEEVEPVEPEDPVNPDPGVIGPYTPSTPIEPSVSIDDVMHDYLSSLTVIAEIDQANLNHIGEALNNEIDLSQDIGQNLLKIARGIIQSNISDGIISIKTIPIPRSRPEDGDRYKLPYEGGGSGSVTTLFQPLGAHPISGRKLENTIKRYKLGEIYVDPIYNDYKDFLVEYSIYLPFSGIHKLDADIIVGTTMYVYVDIDFYMGSMLYHIVIDDNHTNRDIYMFTGNCGIEMPITSKDYSAKYEAIMGGIFSGVGMIAGGMMGGPAGATAGGMIAGIAGAGLKTAGNAATVKGNYMQSGKLIPNAACKSVLYPYLIMSKPQDVTPNIAPVKGLPCHEVGSLGSYTGFTVATQVNLDNVPYATDEDKEIIRSMLADGVYL